MYHYVQKWRQLLKVMISYPVIAAHYREYSGMACHITRPVLPDFFKNKVYQRAEVL